MAGNLRVNRERGALLVFPNVFFYGDLEDIAVSDPALDRWFNIDAGFERDPAKVPASFQKRTFPFRVDGVRGPDLKLLNVSFLRSVDLPGRKTLQLRIDMLNVLNRMPDRCGGWQQVLSHHRRAAWRTQITNVQPRFR